MFIIEIFFWRLKYNISETSEFINNHVNDQNLYAMFIILNFINGGMLRVYRHF